MRLRYAMELVLAIGAGLGLARYRLSWPDWEETFGPMTRFVAVETGADAVLAGIGLVEGVATLAERLRGRSPVPWGPGRRAWVVVAAYVLLTQLDQVLLSAASRLGPGHELDSPLAAEIVDGLRAEYGLFLLPAMTWFLLALGLASLAARPPRDPHPDARECGGRLFAAVVVLVGLGLRGAVLVILPGGMGGGFQ